MPASRGYHWHASASANAPAYAAAAIADARVAAHAFAIVNASRDVHRRPLHHQAHRAAVPSAPADQAARPRATSSSALTLADNTVS